MADVNEVERRALRQDALCSVEAMHVQASSMYMTLSPTPNRPQEKKVGNLPAAREGGSHLRRPKLEPIITGSEAATGVQPPTASQHISSLVRTRPTPFVDSPVEVEKGSLSRSSTKRSVGLTDAYESERGALSTTSTKRSPDLDGTHEPENRPISEESILSAKSPRQSMISSRSARAENGLSPDTSPTRSVIMISPLDTEKWPSSGVGSTDFRKNLAELEARPAPDVQPIA